ncbi:hypothetical protein Tco_0767878 [Tanacetum coccineum]
MQAPLQARFKDLPTVDMKEILQQLMFEDNSYKAHEAHNDLYEALQKSLELDYSNQHLADQEEAHKKKKRKPASSIFESTNFTAAQELSPTDSLMQDDSIPDEQTIPSSNVSDIENNWASTLVSTYETPAENSLLAKTGDMTTFMKWYCRQFQMEECHKIFTYQIDWTNLEGDQVRVDVNQPLPLGGPPGHVTVQPQFFFNKDLEYLRYGSKGSNPALSDFQDEAAIIPRVWWFNRQKFYIDRHDSSSRRKDVRTHMQILSVIKIKAYSRYGYDYLSEIILRRADFQEHMMRKRLNNNLYPSDFKDPYLLSLQGLSRSCSWLRQNGCYLKTAVKLRTRNCCDSTAVEDF